MKVAGFSNQTVVTADAGLGGLAEQLAVQPEPRARLFRQRVNKPEPGVVPGSGVFGTGIAQPDDEAQACHRKRHPSDPGGGLLGATRGRAETNQRITCRPSSRPWSPARRPLPGRLRLGVFLAVLGDHDGDVVFLAQLQLRDLDAGRQLQLGQVDDVADGQVRQIDSMNSGRSFGRQLTSTSFSSCRTTTSAALPAGDLSSLRKCSGTAARRASVGADALEVQVHDLLLERVALDVAQQDLLDVAAEAQVQDRRVEPLVLLASQTFSWSSWMATGSMPPP
jgi:hypothetical protein